MHLMPWWSLLLLRPPTLLQPNDDSHLITQIFQPNIYPNWKLHVFYCIWPNFLVSIFTGSLPWPPPVGFTDIKWVWYSSRSSRQRGDPTRVGMGWRRRARIRRRMGILGRHDEQLCLLSPLQECGPTTTSKCSTPSIRSEAPRFYSVSGRPILIPFFGTGLLVLFLS